jgi:hypothetical protein
MFKAWLILAMATVPCLADVQITTSYNADGQAAETTIWSNGNRMRYDYGSGVVMLRDCDQRKVTQIDEKAKAYLLLPTEEPEDPAAASRAEVTDTGERKELFGHQARHLKIKESAEGKDGKKETTETDGWYLDLTGIGSCFARTAGMRDRGYPASYTITTYGENGKATSTVTMSIKTMADAPLASSMFEVPAGYKDSTPRQVPKNGLPKTPGVIRVGAVLIHDKSNSGVPSQAYYNRLATQLMDAKLDLIQLEDGPQTTIDLKAQEAGCDFVLYTELASVGKPVTNKVTGLLHKAPGIGHVTGGDGMEAHVDYRLVPTSGGSPVLASTAVAKAGTQVNVKAAALLASNLIPMAMGARMFGAALNPTMMNAMVSGHGYGASLANADPMMGGIATLLRAVTQPSGAPGSAARNPMTAEAISAAIDQEGKAVISQLKPPAQ